MKLSDLVKLELIPALGCTEPIAIALASAKAREVLGCPVSDVKKVRVRADRMVYRNGFGVGIPGSNLSGNEFAAALGAVAGDAAKGLEVLSKVEQKDIDAAVELVKENKVDVALAPDEHELFVSAEIFSEQDTAKAVIRKVHNKISEISRNGELISAETAERDEFDLLFEESKFFKDKGIEELIAIAESIDKAEERELLNGVKINKAISDYGIEHGSGLGIGKNIFEMVQAGKIGDSEMIRAKYMVAGGVDARMSGVFMPVMSSGGSGNSGISATLPIAAVYEFRKMDNSRKLAEALMLSHLLNVYIRLYIGRLSSVCGGSIAAGTGAAAGITYLLGGTPAQVFEAIKLMIESVFGVICDGAKPGCSLKLSSAASSAVLFATLALKNSRISAKEGILDFDLPRLLQNLESITKNGYKDVDNLVIKILERKKDK